MESGGLPSPPVHATPDVPLSSSAGSVESAASNAGCTHIVLSAPPSSLPAAAACSVAVSSVATVSTSVEAGTGILLDDSAAVVGADQTSEGPNHSPVEPSLPAADLGGCPGSRVQAELGPESVPVASNEDDANAAAQLSDPLCASEPPSTRSVSEPGSPSSLPSVCPAPTEESARRDPSTSPAESAGSHSVHRRKAEPHRKPRPADRIVFSRMPQFYQHEPVQVAPRNLLDPSEDDFGASSDGGSAAQSVQDPAGSATSEIESVCRFADNVFEVLRDHFDQARLQQYCLENGIDRCFCSKPKLVRKIMKHLGVETKREDDSILEDDGGEYLPSLPAVRPKANSPALDTICLGQNDDYTKLSSNFTLPDLQMFCKSRGITYGTLAKGPLIARILTFLRHGLDGLRSSETERSEKTPRPSLDTICQGMNDSFDKLAKTFNQDELLAFCREKSLVAGTVPTKPKLIKKILRYLHGTDQQAVGLREPRPEDIPPSIDTICPGQYDTFEKIYETFNLPELQKYCRLKDIDINGHTKARLIRKIVDHMCRGTALVPAEVEAVPMDTDSPSLVGSPPLVSAPPAAAPGSDVAQFGSPNGVAIPPPPSSLDPEPMIVERPPPSAKEKLRQSLLSNVSLSTARLPPSHQPPSLLKRELKSSAEPPRPKKSVKFSDEPLPASYDPRAFSSSRPRPRGPSRFVQTVESDDESLESESEVDPDEPVTEEYAGFRWTADEVRPEQPPILPNSLPGAAEHTELWLARLPRSKHASSAWRLAASAASPLPPPPARAAPDEPLAPVRPPQTSATSVRKRQRVREHESHLWLTRIIQALQTLGPNQLCSTVAEWIDTQFVKVGDGGKSIMARINSLMSSATHASLFLKSDNHNKPRLYTLAVPATGDPLALAAASEAEPGVGGSGVDEAADFHEDSPVDDSLLVPGVYAGPGGCQVCRGAHKAHSIILCDQCDDEYHTFCLEPPLDRIPLGRWFCPRCRAEELAKRDAGKEYGFRVGDLSKPLLTDEVKEALLSLGGSATSNDIADAVADKYLASEVELRTLRVKVRSRMLHSPHLFFKQFVPEDRHLPSVWALLQEQQVQPMQLELADSSHPQQPHQQPSHAQPQQQYQQQQHSASHATNDQPTTSEPSFSSGRPARAVAAQKVCEGCRQGPAAGSMLACGTCSRYFHLRCLDPPLSQTPRSRIVCQHCVPLLPTPAPPPPPPAQPKRERPKVLSAAEREQQFLARIQNIMEAMGGTCSAEEITSMLLESGLADGDKQTLRSRVTQVLVSRQNEHLFEKVPLSNDTKRHAQFRLKAMPPPAPTPTPPSTPPPTPPPAEPNTVVDDDEPEIEVDPESPHAPRSQRDRRRQLLSERLHARAQLAAAAAAASTPMDTSSDTSEPVAPVTAVTVKVGSSVPPADASVPAVGASTAAVPENGQSSAPPAGELPTDSPHGASWQHADDGSADAEPRTPTSEDTMSAAVPSCGVADVGAAGVSADAPAAPTAAPVGFAEVFAELFADPPAVSAAPDAFAAPDALGAPDTTVAPAAAVAPLSTSAATVACVVAVSPGADAVADAPPDVPLPAALATVAASAAATPAVAASAAGALLDTAAASAAGAPTVAVASSAMAAPMAEPSAPPAASVAACAAAIPVEPVPAVATSAVVSPVDNVATSPAGPPEVVVAQQTAPMDIVADVSASALPAIAVSSSAVAPVAVSASIAPVATVDTSATVSPEAAVASAAVAEPATERAVLADTSPEAKSLVAIREWLPSSRGEQGCPVCGAQDFTGRSLRSHIGHCRRRAARAQFAAATDVGSQDAQSDTEVAESTDVVADATEADQTPDAEQLEAAPEPAERGEQGCPVCGAQDFTGRSLRSHIGHCRRRAAQAQAAAAADVGSQDAQSDTEVAESTDVLADAAEMPGTSPQRLPTVESDSESEMLITERPVEGGGEHVCPYCPRSFHWPPVLAAHIRVHQRKHEADADADALADGTDVAASDAQFGVSDKQADQTRDADDSDAAHPLPGPAEPAGSPCRFCGQRFLTPLGLRTHERLHELHPKPEPERELVLMEDFDDDGGLEPHTPPESDESEAESEVESELESAVRESGDEEAGSDDDQPAIVGELVCGTCGRRCKSARSLAVHDVRAHRGSRSQAKSGAKPAAKLSAAVPKASAGSKRALSSRKQHEAPGQTDDPLPPTPQGTLFRCPFPGCSKVFPKKKSVVIHHGMQHGPCPDYDSIRAVSSLDDESTADAESDSESDSSIDVDMVGSRGVKGSKPGERKRKAAGARSASDSNDAAAVKPTGDDDERGPIMFSCPKCPQEFFTKEDVMHHHLKSHYKVLEASQVLRSTKKFKFPANAVDVAPPKHKRQRKAVVDTQSDADSVESSDSDEAVTPWLAGGNPCGCENQKCASKALSAPRAAVVRGRRGMLCNSCYRAFLGNPSSVAFPPRGQLASEKAELPAQPDRPKLPKQPPEAAPPTMKPSKDAPPNDDKDSQPSPSSPAVPPPRVCANEFCGVHQGKAHTQAWRKGPHGPATLCEKCGARYLRNANQWQCDKRQRSDLCLDKADLTEFLGNAFSFNPPDQIMPRQPFMPQRLFVSRLALLMTSGNVQMLHLGDVIRAAGKDVIVHRLELQAGDDADGGQVMLYGAALTGSRADPIVTFLRQPVPTKQIESVSGPTEFMAWYQKLEEIRAANGERSLGWAESEWYTIPPEQRIKNLQESIQRICDARAAALNVKPPGPEVVQHFQEWAAVDSLVEDAPFDLDPQTKPGDCSVCNGVDANDVSIRCSGACGRWYHLSCAQLSIVPEVANWVCASCQRAAKVTSKAVGREGRAPHACSTCGRTFELKVALVAHERSHLDKAAERRKFTCSVCGRDFTFRPAWINHERHQTAHEVPETDPPDDVPPEQPAKKRRTADA
eukprot:TRINITY_DN715_c0_g2_i5.p1 TRINITY_DN715_c0_g2~~TRINITY_DN715_c0_g2_i5.p1  ORF type:complete len:2899 (+),score=692.51 TRINITY_DN715_c0_g2_i5:191-8887(+)